MEPTRTTLSLKLFGKNLKETIDDCYTDLALSSIDFEKNGGIFFRKIGYIEDFDEYEKLCKYEKIREGKDSISRYYAESPQFIESAQNIFLRAFYSFDPTDLTDELKKSEVKIASLELLAKRLETTIHKFHKDVALAETILEDEGKIDLGRNIPDIINLTKLTKNLREESTEEARIIIGHCYPSNSAITDQALKIFAKGIDSKQQNLDLSINIIKLDQLAESYACNRSVHTDKSDEYDLSAPEPSTNSIGIA